MLPDPKVKCPATAFKRSCRSIVTADDCICPKFVTIRGKDPQTGELIDKQGCIDSFLHMLQIENTQQSRQTGAAVESFRNEVVKAAEEQREFVNNVLLLSRAASPQPNLARLGTLPVISNSEG